MCRHRQITPTEGGTVLHLRYTFWHPRQLIRAPNVSDPSAHPVISLPVSPSFPSPFLRLFYFPLLVITQSSTHDSTVLLCDEPIVPEKGTIPTLPPYQASRLPPYTSGGANAQHAFQRRQWCCSGWGCCPWPHAQRCYYEGTTSKISRLHRHLGFVFLVLLLTPGN